MGRPKKNGEPAATPTKHKQPDFSGVPGEVVALDELKVELAFGATGGRRSPYDALLDQLAAAGAGKALRFRNERARGSVAARAKKKGMRVSFAVLDGWLYVRFDGSVEDDVRATRRERIKTALKVSGGTTKFALAQVLLAKGDTTVDAHIVEAILLQWQRTGEVIRAEGDVWRLNPAKK